MGEALFVGLVNVSCVWGVSLSDWVLSVELFSDEVVSLFDDFFFP